MVTISQAGGPGRYDIEYYEEKVQDFPLYLCTLDRREKYGRVYTHCYRRMSFIETFYTDFPHSSGEKCI